MLRRTSSLFVAVALALPLGPGCTNKQTLTEVEVPEAGVSLRYDLTAGQTYRGHVKMRSSAQTLKGDMVTTIEFDVELLVQAQKIGDAMVVDATIEAIKLSLRPPEGIPPAMVAMLTGGMTPEKAASLNGMQLPFNLNERGEVDGVPDPPADASPEIQDIMGMIASALTAGFSVRVPEQPVKDGEQWDAKSSTPREGVVSSSNTGSLRGLGRDDAGREIAQLVYAAQVQAQRSRGEQTFEIQQKIDTEVTFCASQGHPVAVERTIRMEIVGQTSVLTEIDAQWSKGGKQAVAPAGDATQQLTDPCDPDYVGAGECVDDGASATPAGDGETTSNAEAAGASE
ncbi:MAG: hypothetical protein AAGF11_05385 [Myxococcota bacterium]